MLNRIRSALLGDRRQGRVSYRCLFYTPNGECVDVGKSVLYNASPGKQSDIWERNRQWADDFIQGHISRMVRNGGWVEDVFYGPGYFDHGTYYVEHRTEERID